MVRPSQVALFITEFRQYWPPKCIVINTPKNVQALADLNITPKQRQEIILHLGAHNYCEGPLVDHDRGGDGIWIFGKKVEGRQIYIKLKMVNVSETYYASCLSFHPAERSLTYPFS